MFVYVVYRHISKSIVEWLTARFEETKAGGRAELVTRAFLRWLDRSLEDLFTEGLRLVSLSTYQLPVTYML